jgi:hypothetical protein
MNNIEFKRHRSLHGDDSRKEDLSHSNHPGTGLSGAGLPDAGLQSASLVVAP